MQLTLRGDGVLQPLIYCKMVMQCWLRGTPKYVHYEDISVGKTYTLYKCWDEGIKCISDNCEITISKIDDDGAIWSEDVTFRGVPCHDGTGWAVADKGTMRDGTCVLLEDA